MICSKLAFWARRGNNEDFIALMDVRLLEAFRAVVDHRSVTNAAAAMGVTQPAVSAQIVTSRPLRGVSR